METQTRNENYINDILDIQTIKHDVNNTQQ